MKDPRDVQAYALGDRLVAIYVPGLGILEGGGLGDRGGGCGFSQEGFHVSSQGTARRQWEVRVWRTLRKLA